MLEGEDQRYDLSWNPLKTKIFEDPGRLEITVVEKKDTNQKGRSVVEIQLDDSARETLVCLGDDQHNEIVDRNFDVGSPRIELSVIGEPVTIYVRFTPNSSGKKKIRYNNSNQILAPRGYDPHESGSNFTDRIERCSPVVDKTGYISDLLEKRSAVIIGPRGFGKTLIVSTIQAIFRNGQRWWDEHCRDTAIYKQRQKIPGSGFDKHPVLHLDFSAVSTAEVLLILIEMRLQDLYKSYLPESNYEALKKELVRSLQYTSEIDTGTTASFMLLITEAMCEIAEQTKRGVVVLIDEYDSPFTSLAKRIIEREERAKKEDAARSGVTFPQRSQEDLDDGKAILGLRDFYETFFKTLKKLRGLQTESNIPIIHFTYTTGIIPIRDIVGNDVVSLRLRERYDLLLGFTEEELLKDSIYRYHFSAIEKQVSKRSSDLGVLAPKNEEIETNKNNLLEESPAINAEDIDMSEVDPEPKEFGKAMAKIRYHYNGYLFTPQQKKTVYNPYSINNLFANGMGGKYQFRSFFALTGSTKLIWRAIHFLSTQQKYKLISGLMDPENKTIIIDSLALNLEAEHTITDIFNDFGHLAFFCGYLTFDESCKEDQIRLKFPNHGIRQRLYDDLVKSLNLDMDSNLINLLSSEFYDQYFDEVDKRMRKLSIFTGGEVSQPSTLQEQQKGELEHEDHAHTLFSFVNRGLEALNKERKSARDFYFYSNKCITSDKRPDCVMSFMTGKNGSKTKRVLIIEFKCKNDTKEAIKLAKESLFSKYAVLKTQKKNLKSEYSHLKDGEYIFVAGALKSGIIHELRFYKLSSDGKSLEECPLWKFNKN